ncbi:integral membrane protein [Patulibacter medicamentivorans]|jgi:FtsH-binding integral membrane protein|uniref:Integral membrane protein n=1 Tax=Patulibacter medicamentivorans TaxID=1097667 RepID=H0E0T1_9ACTN|nr:Bax inhibitor-1 family protein [Patulibacter medicamentivorans]EHN12695.1 integral membrane protein [Patulibacter medicamentivorans]
MPETYSLPTATATRASYGALLAQTMFLVAVAIGFTVLGSYFGGGPGDAEPLSRGAAMGCTIGAIALLFASNFIGALRTGPPAMGVLFGAALLLGLGLGPVLHTFLDVKPDAVTKAAGTTALVVVAAGAGGSLVAKDLAPWMKPISIGLLIAVAVSWGMLIFGGGGGIAGDLVSIAIGGFSAVAIVVYFNVLRQRATEDDVIWIATGIFIGIYNIFVTLLSIFGND